METLRGLVRLLFRRSPQGVEDPYIQEVFPAVVIFATAFAVLLCQRLF